MTEKTTPETLPEVAERKAAKGATYRALVGFNYPRPGASVDTKSPGGKDVKSREIRHEAGEAGITLPDAIVAALGPAVIEKE